MPLRKAEVSHHAWLRFLKRREGDPPECYRTELARMIAEATEEDLGYGTAIRMLKNSCIPARYWRSGDWRFVTNEEVTCVFTIERAYVTAKKPMKWHKNKKRYGGKP
jgi:hypothetical protein